MTIRVCLRAFKDRLIMVSGNYTVSAVHKRPRDAVCRYLTKNDGTIKIIREVEEDQDGEENRSD